MGNEASIDLVANPTKFNQALVAAGANTDKFATNAATSLQKVDVAAKGVTTDFTALGASAVKNAPAIAAIAFSFTKFSFQLELAKLATELLADQFEKTGQSIGVIDERLSASRKILAECQGDVDKLATKLDEMGITAEEAGIKVETNWSRIKEAWKKLFAEITDKDAPEEIKKVSNAFDRFSQDLMRNHDQQMTEFADFFKGIADQGTEAVKKLRSEFTEWFIEMQGFNQIQIRQLMEQDAKAEQAAKDSKVRQIREEMFKKELADFQEFSDARARLVVKQTAEDEAAYIESAEILQKKIDLMAKERREMTLNGQMNDKVLSNWLDKENALYSRQQQIIEQSVRLGKVVRDTLGKPGERSRENEVEAERELNAAREMGVGLARSLKELAEEELAELLEQNLAVQQTVEWQEKVEAALRRLALFRRAEHDAELREVEEVNARKVRDANLQIALNKQIRESRQDVEGTRIAVSQNKQLADLEKQGVGFKKLHELRMKFIDEEEKRAINNLEVKDPIAIERIKADAEQQRIREVAAFEAHADADRRAAVKLREAEKRRLEDENFEKSGASEREIHQRRMQRIKDEAAEETRLSNSELEKEQIKINLARQLKEEKERFIQLQKEGVDVDAKQNQQPLTPKEQRAQMRAAREKLRAAAKAKNSREGRIAARQAKIDAAKIKQQQSPAARRSAAIRGARQDERMKGALQVQSIENSLKDAFAKFDTAKDKIRELALAKDANKLLQIIARAAERQLVKNDNLLNAIKGLVGVGKLK